MSNISTNGAADARRRGYLGHRQPTCERLRMADEAYKSGKLEHPSLATCAFAHRVPLSDLLNLRHHKTGNGHGNGNGAQIKAPSPQEMLGRIIAELGVDEVFAVLVAAASEKGAAA